MNWPLDRELQLRMALAATLLAVVAVAFAAGVAAVFAGVAAFLGFPPLGGAALALLVLAALFALELVSGDHVVREAGAYEIDAGTAPRFERTVRSVAQQADVPEPTLAVCDTEAPEAFTTGYRPSTTTLVVSTGLLRALDDGELRAVVAHELAHVKNRDVALMTATALPTAVARRLRETVGGDDGETSRGRYRSRSSTRGGPFAIVAAALYLVATAAELLGRLLVGVFSRARELAADRGAVAITGDPAALDSALSTINGALVDRPADDLRGRRNVVAFTIVSPGSTDADDPVMLGPEGDREATYYNRSRRLDAWVERLVSTHPPVADRRGRLRALDPDAETDSPR